MKKVKLFHNDSALHRLNYRINDTTIFMKRDDVLDFAMGGNKVRLYEYIAGKIEEANVERVVTFGSKYSNFLRVTAAVCSKLNIPCDLIVLDDDHKYSGGNEILIGYHKANILHCRIEDAHEFIDVYQKQLETQGVKYIWIPGGGHMPEAGFAYNEVIKSLYADGSIQNNQIDAIFVPCGTGTSQAGIIYGNEDRAVKIYGVTIARPIERCISEIDTILNGMSCIEGKEHQEHEINVIESGIRNYGEINDVIEGVIEEIAVSDGIYLDPIYNAPAFYGMRCFLKSHQEYKNVIYINTGGVPNVFLNKE